MMKYAVILCMVSAFLSPLPAQFGFDFSCLDDTVQTGTDLMEFYFRLENTGSVPDSFAFDCEVIDSVQGWSVLYCAGGSCAEPGIILYGYLNAGAVDTNIHISVFPSAQTGTEVVRLRVTSVGNPSLTDSATVYAVKEVGTNELKTHSSSVEGLLTITPNPFSKETDIVLNTGQKNGNAELYIYDVSGRPVRHLIAPTAYSVLPTVITWDGTDTNNRRLPCGIYFIQMRSHDYSVTGEVLLLR